MHPRSPSRLRLIPVRAGGSRAGTSTQSRPRGSGLRTAVIGMASAVVLGASLAEAAMPAPVARITPAAAAADLDDDWNTLQGLLPGYAGTWSSPPTGTVTDVMTDGALLGNGDLGVTVGGDRNTLRLYLSKNDFWTSPGPDGAHPITLGGLTLRRAAGTDTGTAYSMTQDILNAEVRTDLTVNNVPVRTRSYVADSADVVVTEISSTGTAPVTLALDAWTKSGNSAYPSTSGVSGSTLWAARSTQNVASSEWVSRMAVATRVLGAAVTTSTNSTGTSTAQFTVNPGATVTVVAAVEGGRGVTDHVTRAKGTANALTAASVTNLGTEHRAWWKDYWLKSYVRVFDPTLEKYYYGSQYVLGSASRSGSTAPNLWGAWITTDTPLWGDYHLNYNAQSPYYGTFSSNRVDVADPLNQVVLDYRATGAANIARLQTTPAGFGVSQHFKDAVPASTRGYLYPVGIGPQGSTNERYYWNQPTNATYAAVTLVYRYEYQPDTRFLGGTLYPYLLQLANFWEDYVGPKEADGKYHFMGAAYEDEWAKDDSLSLAAIRYVLTRTVKYSELLGVDAGRRALWNDILANLPDFPTAVHNGKTVYNRDHSQGFAELVGRTICNLEFTHPFDLLDLDSPQSQRQTAIDTLDAMDSWNQGNNLAKSYGVAAHIGYPAAALQSRLKSITSGMRANHTIYQGGGGLESVSATDAINAMLVQSVNGTIRLFPNYPAGQRAHFSRLRTKGGFLVTADYDGGTASNVSLTADNGGTPATVLNPWPGRAMRVTDAGGNPVPTTVAGDRYTFPTTAGATYTIAPQTMTGGAVTGSVAGQPAGTVDLAAQGSTDWAHWGLTSATSYDHKSGVTPAISNLTQVGGNPVLRLDDSQVAYSWTGGTPTAAATATRTAVFTRGTGNGFRFTVPASSTTQRLRVHLGGWSAKGRFTATLSDGSAPSYSSDFDSPSGNGYGTADITFRAATPGQTLTVTYTAATSYSGNDGNVTLHAATLAPVPGELVGIASLCADVRSASTANGTPIQTYGCNNTAAQRWTATADNRLVALGKCMDVTGGGTANNTKVQLYDCNNTDAQVWVPQAGGGLLNPKSGRCLDVPGAATTWSTQLQIHDCNQTNAQKWRLP